MSRRTGVALPLWRDHWRGRGIASDHAATPSQTNVQGISLTNSRHWMETLQDLDLSWMSALGATLLRITLAGFWIIHWWFKVGYRGMAATQAFFQQHGLPPWLAWFVIGFELVVAACLILGIYVRLVCVASLPILLVSIWIYRRNGLYFSKGGVELPMFWACAQIAQILLGPGAVQVPLPAWVPELATVIALGL
jgi:putative oxidoreductase